MRGAQSKLIESPSGLIRLSMICLTLFFLNACSPSKQPVAGPSTKPASEEEVEEPQTEEVEDLASILKQCGVSESDLEKPDEVILEKTIRGYPKVFTGTEGVPLLGNINYRVAVTTVVSIKATLREINQDTDFEIKGEPSQAEGKAWEKAAPNQGSTTMRLLDNEERATLMSKSQDWAGVFCTLMPAHEVSTSKGGVGRIVKFKPALPGSLSPRADAKRYLKELGEQRFFDNIKAEIIASDDPDFPEGTTLTGSAVVTKVNPTLKIMAGDTQKATIDADVAYKISYDFGSRKNTVGVGLMPSQTMYIDYEDKEIRVIVADTGFEEGGTVVLSDEL